MNFDKKIAATVLELLEKFPPDIILGRTPPGGWACLIPDGLHKQLTSTNILTHLYILSNSGLVFPQMCSNTIQQLVRDSAIDHGSFWRNELPQHLARYKDATCL